MTAFRGVSLLVACALAAKYTVEQQSEFMHDVTSVSNIVVVCAIVLFHALFVTIALVPAIVPDSRWWYVLGSLTYPLYLVHNRIGRTLWSHLPYAMPVVVAYVILFVVTYAIASVIAAGTKRRGCSTLQRLLQRYVGRLRVLRWSSV